MGSLSRSLLTSAIVIGLALEATYAGSTKPSEHKEYKNRYYTTTIDNIKNERPCKQEITIKGNGVDDTFTEPCVDNLSVMNTDELLVVGDPQKDPFSLICFGDTANVIVVIKDGICKMRMYTEDDPMYTNPKSQGVTAITLHDNVCVDLQTKVNNLVKKHQSDVNNGEVSKNGEHGYVNSDQETGGDSRLNNKYTVIVTNAKKVKQCIQEIKIEGNGVEDVFKGPCVNDLQIVNTKDVMAVGNPEKNPFTLFSNKMKTLIIVKDDKCKQKSYRTSNSLTMSTPSELDDDECEEIKKKIKKLFVTKASDKGDGKLSSKYVVTTDTTQRRGKCIQEIKISGNGVEDNFRGPCVDDLKIINEKDILVIGDPEKNTFSLFSEKPNTLVTLKDGLCKERTYETVKGKITSSSTDLDIAECDEIEGKIKKEFQKKKEINKDDSEQEESPYVVTTNTFQRNGKCFQNIKIKGNGIEDTFRGPCVDDLEIIKKKNLLLVGDPDKNPFSFLSDKPDTLVIVKDSLCKMRTYKTVNGKTTSSSRDLDDDECEEVEDKIAEQLEKNRKGGDEEENRKYSVTTDTFGRRGKCIQIINIQGNGVEDSFRGPCVDDLPIVKSDVLVVGNPDTNSFSLFSDKANSLIIVKDGICKERTYKTVKGKTTSSSAELVDDECEEIEDKIIKELKKKDKYKKGGNGLDKFYAEIETSNRRGKCFLDIKIEGNGVKDSFKGPCSDDFKAVNKKEFLLVAYPYNEPFSVFTTKPNSLLIVKDGLCKERTYKTVDGKITSTSVTLEEDECENIQDTIDEKLSGM